MENAIIIPFDLNTARKIKSGEIEGSVLIEVIIYHFTQKRKTIYICTKYHTGYHQYPLPVAQK